MKKQLLSKVLGFIVLVIIFFTLTDFVNAQKKCHDGKCPIGYACAPSGYCVRSCSHCQPFLFDSANEVISTESSQLAVIQFQIDKAKGGFLKIYDVTGRLIRTLVNESSQHHVHQFLWNKEAQQFAVLDTYGKKLTGYRIPAA